MSASVGVLFAFVAGASFGGVLPSQLRLLAAGLALVGFVAAALFTGEARGIEEQLAQLNAERAQAALDERLLVAVAAVADVDATLIGVDRAVQEILPGGALPRYVARDVDEQLRAAFAAAFDGRGPWIVVAVGTSKAGKSRALFEALEHCTRGKAIDLVAPRDGDALRSMLIPGQAPVQRSAVLWLDDIEPFLGDNVTVHTLLAWRDAFAGGVVAATLGGKGAGRVLTSSAPTVSVLADAVLTRASRVEVAPTAPHEVQGLLASVSSREAAAIQRHGLAAFLVAAPKLEIKLSTCRHEGGPPCPEGRAVVDVAVDWARCGRTDAITQATLRALCTGSPHGAPLSDEGFAAALAWALRPVAGTIALLHHVQGGYEAFDYIVALARDTRAPDDHVWVAAIATATDAQALSVGIAAFGRSRLDDAVNAFARASTSTTREIAAISTFDKGVTLGVLGRSDDEIAVYDELIARDADRDELALREQVAKALVNKGFRLGVLGRSDDAIAVYDELIARDADRDELALREPVANALVNKGVRLGVLGRSDDAIAVYDELIARDADRDELALREQVAKALVNKGFRLGVLGRSDDEIAVYDELIARDADRDELALREQVANALVNKGFRLGVLGRSDDAIAVYDELIARDADRDELALREPVANALVNKGVTLGVLGRSDDEIAVYDELIARDADRDELALREQVANALVNKGVRLGVLGRSDDEIAVYDELIARDGDRDELALREQVANALVNKGVRLGVLGRSDDAIAVYDELIAHYDDAPEPALRKSVANALGNSAKLRLERREYAGAIDMIRSAFQHADDDSDPLRAELWMYLFALGPHDQRANARVELVRLLRAGVRSPGWDFSLIVANAIEQRHDDSDRLVALADVISTHEDIRILDGWMVETDQ